MSRVARKRSLARQRLVDAAGQLIAEHGVEGLRLRELAERADIGFGSFYNHFGSKEELVEAVVAEHLGALTNAIIATAAATSRNDGSGLGLGNSNGHDDPAETVAEAHRKFVRVAYDDPQLARLIVQLDRADALLETATHPHLTPLLERGIASGRFSTGIDVEVAVSFIVGATIAVMRGILDGRLGPHAEIASARTLLRACGLSDKDAGAIA
ncbi:MAG: TetR/AcrR family transcriptional regulator [Solirubrobacteraceae bacterium]